MTVTITRNNDNAQLQLHYATTTVAVHHTTSSSCGEGRWPLQPCATIPVKMYKTPQRRTTFGSWDVEKVLEKVHAVGAKHISKSKV